MSGTGYYVAKDGNDHWSGRLAQPNASHTDGPLASLGAAQRKMESSSIKTTYIESGTYNSQLNLSNRDSGETWSNYKGQSVTINGHSSRTINDFGASNVTISGLHITGGSTYEVQISGASNVTVQNSTINSGSTGILLSRGGSGSKLLDNNISGVSDNGVMITSGVNSVTVSGNDIHDLGKAKLGAGIWFEGSSHDVFSYNTIENIGKFAIGGGTVHGGDAPASYNTITHNTIDHANLEYPDAGAINILDDEQNSTGNAITYNKISDTSEGSSKAWIGPAVYLDNFVSGATIHGNLMVNNQDGVWIHLGHNNTISNNVITGSKVGLAMDGYTDNGITPHAKPTGNVFEDNVVYLGQSGAMGAFLQDEATKYAYYSTKFVDNTYGGPAVGSRSFGTDVNHGSRDYSLSGWQGQGYDHGSVSSSHLTLSQAMGHSLA